MRRFSIPVFLLLTAVGIAAPKLNRETATKRIDELTSSTLALDAIEIREITQTQPDRAIAESTITLAFQFKKLKEGAWEVDAIRFGDRDWVNMSELMAAVSHGRPPDLSGITPTPPVKPATPIETLHVNENDFERERSRMIELGASPLIPGAIEIRRVISQNDTRTIAEATVTMGFRFVYRVKSKSWNIDAARLGDGDWIDTVDLLATLNEGRRRATLASMEKLAAAIEHYRQDKGSFPPAKTVAELMDVLHPRYIDELVRADGWGQEIEYSATESTFRLRSRGPDGRLFSADDIVVNPGAPPSP
jgi:hypothetical protein